MIYVGNWHSGVIMDRIRLLQSRKKQILDAGKDIRKDINSLVDDKSFV